MHLNAYLRIVRLTNMIHFFSVLDVTNRNVGIIQMEPETIQRTRFVANIHLHDPE